MLEEFAERIQNAKDKQFKIFERFHIGDTVYPFWLKNFLVYGTVIDIDTVCRKIICDFNGVMRQFSPEDLMVLNPQLACRGQKEAGKTASRRLCAKLDKKGYKSYVVLVGGENDGQIESGWEYKEDAVDHLNELKETGVKCKVMSNAQTKQLASEDANWFKGNISNLRKASAGDDETHLSPDVDNGIHATCKDCGGEIAVSYNEQTAKTDFVCTKCGKRISEDRISTKTKKAMRRMAMRHMDAVADPDQPIYESKAPVGELDRKSYKYYVLLDMNGSIESGHETIKQATDHMESLKKKGVSSHVVAREDLNLRPTDDTHWYRGIVASVDAVAKELVAIAKEISNLE